MALISHAYDLNNIILMSARLPQILQNFSARSTGQLSVITYAANTLGCVARLFTTMQEGGGSAMFRQYCISEWHSSCGRGCTRPNLDTHRVVLLLRFSRVACARACLLVYLMQGAMAVSALIV